MLKTNKSLFYGEKVARGIKYLVEEIYIDQLANDNLESDERQEIAKQLKEVLKDNHEWDEENSKWWYKYGNLNGINKGMVLASVLAVAGFVTGSFIKNKL